jgi:hypothetical protein
MSIRVNDVCFTCGEGKMVKLASYPTIRGVRAYHFQCSVCKKILLYLELLMYQKI